MRQRILNLFTLTYFIFGFEAEAGAQSFNTEKLLQPSTTYTNAVGVRAGQTGAITLKHKLSTGAAVEGILGFWNYGASATLLYEKYVSAFSIAGLNWYYGAGGHFSFSNHYFRERPFKENRYRYYYYNSDFGIGIDGIIGLEYKIPQIPFAISIDAIPFVEVISTGNVWGTIDPGFGIKLVF